LEKRKKIEWGYEAERLAPMREDFPNENFLNEGRVIVNIKEKERIKDLGYFEGSKFLPFYDNFID